MSIRLNIGWLGLLCMLATGTLAQQPAAQAPAYEVVQVTTQRVMETVAAAADYAESDPERYYEEIHAALDPVIDYRGFARSVMGPYASSQRYRSLDEAGRAQLRDQLDRFTEVMRVGLVRTYGKGLLAFGGSRIEVAQPPPEASSQSRVSVRQMIYSDQSEPYVMLYQMGLDKSGQWMLRNVIIEGVNLGEIYRSQFEAAARKYDGDIDDVIANWTTSEVDVEAEKKAAG